MKNFLSAAVIILIILNSCQKPGSRLTVSLNGVWKVAEGNMDQIPPVFDHSVPVPGLISLATPPFINAGPKVSYRRSIIQKDSLREAFWYSRTFKIDGPMPSGAVLKVSKAMFGTKVWLNGKPYFMRGSNITLYRFFEDE